MNPRQRVDKQLKVFINQELAGGLDDGLAGGLVTASKSSKTPRGWPNTQTIQNSSRLKDKRLR